ASLWAGSTRQPQRPPSLPRHPVLSGPRNWRTQGAAITGSDQNGRCPLAWQKIRPRILPILAMPKSDAMVYGLAVLLGICAGTLEITANDILATALFVLVSTLVLGFLRPRQAWRWIIVVGVFVPLARLLAYLLL